MFDLFNIFYSEAICIDAAKLFVAAIDFGTTYSGYAFSAKSTPNDIFTCNWKKSTLVSMKAPTAVLLDKEKNFVAFGFEAETTYLESLENDDSDSDDDDTVFHYFDRFKMMLHNQVLTYNFKKKNVLMSRDRCHESKQVFVNIIIYVHCRQI